SLELRLARARYWAYQGGAEASKALALLSRDLDHFPAADRLRLLRVLGEAHHQTGDYPGATRLWRPGAGAGPAHLGRRFTLFELALLRDDPAAMRKLIHEIQTIEGKDEGTLWRYCAACERIWQAEHGDRRGLAEAADLLKVVGDRRPGWARVPLAQGQV